MTPTQLLDMLPSYESIASSVTDRRLEILYSNVIVGDVLGDLQTVLAEEAYVAEQAAEVARVADLEDAPEPWYRSAPREIAEARSRYDY